MTSPPDAAVTPALGRPARARRWGDRRGLTVLGALVLYLVVGLTAAAFDVRTGSGLRLVFGVAFIVVCALTAALVHREDLRAAVVVPPLAYVVLALIGSARESQASRGSVLSQQALEVLNALVLGAPVLVAGTLAALLVVLVRAVRRRRG